MDGSRNASLTLSDGTRWSSDQFSVEGSWRGSENVIWLDFIDPAPVSEIRTLTLFGEELSLAP